MTSQSVSPCFTLVRLKCNVERDYPKVETEFRHEFHYHFNANMVHMKFPTSALRVTLSSGSTVCLHAQNWGEEAL